MVTDGPDVENVLFGEAGAAKSAAPGALFIDMSTIAPDASRSVSAEFVRAYRQTLGSADFVPASTEEFGVLLDAFLLEKVF